MTARPLPVTLVAWLYIVVGVGGFAAHFPDLLALHPDSYAMEATELLAAIAGVFLLRGRNWARWLACAWMAFHVAISLGEPAKLLVHSLLLALIAGALFYPAARNYFRRSDSARSTA